jgi:hypothetical protein
MAEIESRRRKLAKGSKVFRIDSFVSGEGYAVAAEAEELRLRADGFDVTVTPGNGVVQLTYIVNEGQKPDLYEYEA